MGGMIVLQILAFAVFSFGIFKTEHQGAEQDRYFKLTDQLSRVDALSFKYTAVDASLRTYNASPSIDTLEQLVAQLDTTQTEVEILQQTLGSASNITGKLAELNTTLNAFDTDVVALKQAQTKFREANTSLRDIGDEQIKQTKAVIEAAYAIGDSFSAYRGNLALIDAMTAQTFVRDFLATGNPELLEDARALLATSADNVSQIIQRTQNKPYQVFAIEVEKLLSGYVTVIDQLTASRTERRSLYATIDSHNITARSILAQLVQQTAKADTTNRAELAAEKDSSVLTFAIASGAVLLFGLISSAAFVANLRRDISSSISEMMAVADGDFELEVSGLDRKNELGQIARALDVLRKEGARAKELTRQNAKEANKRIELEQANAQQREAQLKKEREQQEKEAKRIAVENAEMVRLRADIANVVDAASDGDFTKRIVSKFEDRDLQNVAASINALVAQVEDGLQTTGLVMERLASGDVGARMEGTFHGAFARLQETVNETVQSLAQLVSTIQTDCSQLDHQSADMTLSSNDMAKRAEQQASALEETTAAMLQIKDRVDQSTKTLGDISRFADTTSMEAENASNVVSKAVDAMKDIETASGEISKIVGVIDEIAFQTNLLALNASVEAARAGEAGKGFSVVATEVRALAQRSANASSDIRTLIETNVSDVTKGAALVGNTGDALTNILAQVQKMSANLGDLREGSEVQVDGLTEISTALEALDKLTQHNANIALTGRETAQNLKSQVANIQGAISVFQHSDASANGGGTSAYAEVGAA